MLTRKIQLIANTTYTVSLPKEWIINNHLKEKESVSIKINDDKTLTILPATHKSSQLHDSFSVNIAKYGTDIDQVIFSLYYAGFESIILYSHKSIADEIKAVIQKTLTNLSGTEIVYEDSQKIQLRVLLDKSKINIHQIFFRLTLLIASSIECLKCHGTKESLRINEKEADRLYHLAAKILFLSSLHSDILKSSGVGMSSHIIPYFLIAKKLENIADQVYVLGKVAKKNEEKLFVPMLEQSLLILRRASTYLNENSESPFKKTPKREQQALEEKTKMITDINTRLHLLEMIRYIFDIEEELVNISFYKTLARMEFL